MLRQEGSIEKLCSKLHDRKLRLHAGIYGNRCQFFYSQGANAWRQIRLKFQVERLFVSFATLRPALKIHHPSLRASERLTGCIERKSGHALPLNHASIVISFADLPPEAEASTDGAARHVLLPRMKPRGTFSATRRLCSVIQASAVCSVAKLVTSAGQLPGTMTSTP